MVHGLTPVYLNRLVPPKENERHSHNTRQSDNIMQIKCRTTCYKNSFLPSTIQLWNDLPVDIKNNPSISNLKRHLNRNINTPPPYYYSGNRRAQVLHTRLRLKCSALNEHLYSKNIIESPLCTCGTIEDTKHYLFDCPRYITIRDKYFSVLTFDLNTSLLLNGDPSLHRNQNCQIFKAVHKFIIKSKRFQD